MARRNPKIWRTERFIVEVPISGDVSRKSLRWHVEQALEHGAFTHSLTKYNSQVCDSGGIVVQVGRVRVKDAARVAAAEKVIR